MKIKLLNDGWYSDMENVSFPAVVEAIPARNEAGEIYGWDVSPEELYRIGANGGKFDGEMWFWAPEEVLAPKEAL